MTERVPAPNGIVSANRSSAAFAFIQDSANAALFSVHMRVVSTGSTRPRCRSAIADITRAPATHGASNAICAESRAAVLRCVRRMQVCPKEDAPSVRERDAWSLTATERLSWFLRRV